MTVDRNYHIRTINVAARRLLGIHGAGIGEDLIHRVPPSLAGPLRVALDAAFRGESTTASHHLPEDVLDDGGRDLTISAYLADLHDGDGANNVVAVAVEDCTAQSQRERELEADRARLRAELDRQTARATQAVAEVRELRAVNEELATIGAKLRVENEELLVANEEAQAAAEEIETLNEELQATIEELQTTNDELQARTGELQDLALSREAESARLAAVLAGIGDAVLVVDRHGRPVLTNDAYQRHFGADAEFRPEDEAGEPLPPEATPST